MLSVRSVVHRYAREVVLQAPDFDLADGEHCLLAGASGSGKSTLLHILAGIVRPTTGTVHLDGEDLHPPGGRDDRWRGRRIGVVPQRLHLVGSLSALRNVELACHFAGTDAAAAPPLLAELGLAQRAAARPAQLSVGEQQRVAVARAVVTRPRLLLADEPTSSLDDANAALAIELLVAAADRAGALLVVATHDARIRPRFAKVVPLARPAA
jgi:putative ABC transport system ATP-binding protein